MIIFCLNSIMTINLIFCLGKKTNLYLRSHFANKLVEKLWKLINNYC